MFSLFKAFLLALAFVLFVFAFIIFFKVFFYILLAAIVLSLVACFIGGFIIVADNSAIDDENYEYDYEYEKWCRNNPEEIIDVDYEETN